MPPVWRGLGPAAMFLTRAAEHLHVPVRGDSLAASMSDDLRKRLESDPAITIHWRTELIGVYGGESLEAVDVHGRISGKSRRMSTRGVFAMVGAAPNTAWLDDRVELEDRGYVKSGADVGRTIAYV